MISIQGAPVPAPTGISVAELDSAIAHAVGTEDTVLGIRQGDDVYPLQVVAATPGSFGTGDFQAILAGEGGEDRGSTGDRVAQSTAPLMLKLPGGQTLAYSNSDLAEVYTLVTHTGIYGLDPHDIYDAVLIVTAGEHSMTFSQYQSYVRTLIGKPDSEKNFVVTRLLFGLFHAIDINSTGVVSTDDLTAVLVVS